MFSTRETPAGTGGVLHFPSSDGQASAPTATERSNASNQEEWGK